MIELKNDALVFAFPEVHPRARLTIEFQRTLRIPDDGKTYRLPPGLGRFPLRHVDDFRDEVPAAWLEHGGVMLPMYQAEALWINFGNAARTGLYPFAVKVAAGKVNAITGEAWTNDLGRRPQDYAVTSRQPWLDGYSVEKGVIRQFVAMPLGAGYSAEEQITGEAEHGGIQLVVYPMKREAFEHRLGRRKIERHREPMLCMGLPRSAAPDMGLAPGGRMRQEVYEDPYDFREWDQEHGSRCFVHIANSLVWQAITSKRPPTPPPTASQYTKAGLPWFDFYGGDAAALKGAKKLETLESVVERGREKEDAPLPENESVTPRRIVRIRADLAEDQVREGTF